MMASRYLRCGLADEIETPVTKNGNSGGSRLVGESKTVPAESVLGEHTILHVTIYPRSFHVSTFIIAAA